MKYLLAFLVFLNACGGGTSTGNPYRGTVQSSAYTDPNNTKGLTALTGRSPSKTASGVAKRITPITGKSGFDFKLCVGAVAFENSQNERFETYLDDIGLIDLSDVTKTVTWGTVEAREAIEFDTVIISVVYDPELCGEDYSLLYEGQELTVDFEFVFTSNELGQFSDREYFRLDVQKIAEAVEDATNSGDFDDFSWLDYIDDFEGDFEEDDDEFDDPGTIGD
jgi:hypothetical protein